MAGQFLPSLRNLMVAGFLSVLLILLGGCDAGGPAENEPSFEATARGPVDASLEGTARMSATGIPADYDGYFPTALYTDPDEMRAITLSADREAGTGHLITFLFGNATVLNEGRFAVEASYDWYPCGRNPCDDGPLTFATFYSRLTSDSLYFYYGNDGAVEIEEVSDAHVEGVFSFTAERMVAVAREDIGSGQPLIVHSAGNLALEGTFEARRGVADTAAAMPAGR